MADYPAATMGACRRQRVNGAFEAIECMCAALFYDLNGLFVIIAADITYGHDCLLLHFSLANAGVPWRFCYSMMLELEAVMLQSSAFAELFPAFRGYS